MNKPTMITESIATGVLQNHKIKYLLSSFQEQWLKFRADMMALDYQLTSTTKMNKVISILQKVGTNASIDAVDTSMLDTEETYMLENWLQSCLTYFAFEGTDVYGFSCVFYKLIDPKVRTLVEEHLGIAYSEFINVPNWKEIVAGFKEVKQAVFIEEEKELIAERIKAFKLKINFFAGVSKIGEGLDEEFEREIASTSKKLKAAKRTMIAHNYEDYFRRQYAKQDSMMLEYNLIKNHYTQTTEN